MNFFIRSVNYLTLLDRFFNHATEFGRMGPPSGQCRLKPKRRERAPEKLALERNACAPLESQKRSQHVPGPVGSAPPPCAIFSSPMLGGS
jgi:hypothetical protein